MVPMTSTSRPRPTRTSGPSTAAQVFWALVLVAVIALVLLFVFA